MTLLINLSIHRCLINKLLWIFKKIIKIRKSNSHETQKIITLINSTVKNINLLNDFIKLIEDYTNETVSEHKKNNIHSCLVSSHSKNSSNLNWQ